MALWHTGASSSLTRLKRLAHDGSHHHCSGAELLCLLDLGRTHSDLLIEDGLDIREVREVCRLEVLEGVGDLIGRDLTDHPEVGTGDAGLSGSRAQQGLGAYGGADLGHLLQPSFHHLHPVVRLPVSDIDAFHQTASHECAPFAKFMEVAVDLLVLLGDLYVCGVERLLDVHDMLGKVAEKLGMQVQLLRMVHTRPVQGASVLPVALDVMPEQAHLSR